MSKSSPHSLGVTGSTITDSRVRLRDLPDTLADYSPDLLALLCIEKGWNVQDIYNQVTDTYPAIEARLEHLGIEPDPRPSPTNEPAGTLWHDLDPEDVGLTRSPDDWQFTESVQHEIEHDTYQTAVYDWDSERDDQ